ncbi:hypothetical protein I9054_007510 [Acinetobacter bereziniae]|uniref:Uncharacterized protein n=1 Tax=Acinetobacter bereziniae TaxID=106648 RepID=A0A8I1DIQ0_ACIBZ|nr:hypothetical protein [Acinetobacter bereziniae]UUN99291.1 hypothetical protein I9054_007510 [Acinetobacter bereziniae]
MQFNKSSLTFSVLAIMASTAYAQTEVGLEQHADTQKLPTITVQAENNQQPYAAKTALLHKPICKGFFSDIIFK